MRDQIAIESEKRLNRASGDSQTKKTIELTFSSFERIEECNDGGCGETILHHIHRNDVQNYENRFQNTIVE